MNGQSHESEPSLKPDRHVGQQCLEGYWDRFELRSISGWVVGPAVRASAAPTLCSARNLPRPKVLLVSDVPGAGIELAALLIVGLRLSMHLTGLAPEGNQSRR